MRRSWGGWLFCVTALLTLAAGSAPLAGAELGTEQQREAGRQLYDKYCGQCHGPEGDGNGHATPRVKPRPRDLTSAKYKFRTTPSGKLPIDADLRRVIRLGLPYTSMPGWPNLNDQQIQNLVYYLKTFSADFQNPDMAGEPITIGQPLPSTEESIERGRVLYEEQGCAACHGEQGRSDGPSALTLTDDWGHHIRPADLTQRWTFRGGATKQDIFRTFSTGLNGTPMPSYADVLGEEDRWHLVNYIYSLGQSDAPNYASLLIARFVEEELDLEQGVELFESAPRARFPLIGQIIQPGRNFYPSATSIEVQAVYNPKEIAFLLRWNDMRAETTGHNAPDLAVQRWEQEHPEVSPAAAEDDFFAGLEGPAGAPADEDDFFGGLEVEQVGGMQGEDDDFFGGLEQTEGADDFFAQAEPAASPGTEFNDAVAIQLPLAPPTGNRKPYFIFGDAQSPVDLWFVDLAAQRVDQYIGRGSDSIETSETAELETWVRYDDGEWQVAIKRSLRTSGGITIGERQYVPIAFSVWDGFNRERGNKRSLSSWFYFYTEPREKETATVPMLRTALLVLLVELAGIALIRRRWSAGRVEGTSAEPEPSGREVAT